MGAVVGAGAEVTGCSSGKWTGKQIGEGERKMMKKNGGAIADGIEAEEERAAHLWSASSNALVLKGFENNFMASFLCNVPMVYVALYFYASWAASHNIAKNTFPSEHRDDGLGTASSTTC